MKIQFEHAWILYMIWLVPAIAAWWLAIRKRGLRALNNFISPQLREKLFPAQKSLKQRLWQIWLLSSALLLLLIAAAGPQWGEREETVYQQARDLVIAVDVSRSMLANDVHPSRLQRAKIDLVDLIKELNGDRAALIAFRAKASLVCPLTTDYAFLRQALDGLSPNSAPRGCTDIGAAITKALESFNDDDSSHKAIILISDGEDLTGKAQELAKLAGKKKIPIFTVGIGSRRGSRIPDTENKAGSRYLRHQNKDVVTKLNHKTLYAIAKASGGSYIPVETASMTSTTLGTIYRDHLRQINARELSETRKTRAIERYQWFLLPAIILLLSAAALSLGRIGKPRSKKSIAPQAVAAALLLLAFSSGSVFAQSTNTTNETDASNTVSEVTGGTNAIDTAEVEAKFRPGRKGARKAQKLFKAGKYKEAAAAYRYAARGVDRETSRTFLHNAAVALAEAGKPEDSAAILRELSLQARPEDRDENLPLGIMTYRIAEKLKSETPAELDEKADVLREAGEAFKEAWRADSERSDAPHNIAVLLPQIAKAKEQSKILRLTEEYAKTPATQLADKMLEQQRALTVKIPSAITNNTPDRITQLEALSTEQNDIADLWIPLKGKLSQAMQQQGSASNAQHFAALNQLMERTRDEMHKSATELRDLNAEGFRSAKVAEHETYQLWKTVASYNMLLTEDIQRQTNNIDRTSGRIKPSPYTITTAENQQECLQLTQFFKKRFEKAVPPKGNQQPAQPLPQGGQPPAPVGPTIANAQQLPGGSATNAPKKGISAEDRAKIVKLTDETIELQQQALKMLKKQHNTESLDPQKQAHHNLLEIQKLLPKDQNQNNKDQQQKKNQKQQKKKKKQKQDKKKNQQQQKPNQPDQQKKHQDQKKKQEQQKKQKEDQKQRDIRKILQKALEREREHKEEKERRMNQIPLPSFERDW